MGKIISALVLFILGGFMVVCTKAVVRLQTWSQRTIMGAQYIPSQRTNTVVRIIGGLLIIIGLIVVVGILR